MGKEERGNFVVMFLFLHEHLQMKKRKKKFSEASILFCCSGRQYSSSFHCYHQVKDSRHYFGKFFAKYFYVWVKYLVLLELLCLSWHAHNFSFQSVFDSTRLGSSGKPLWSTIIVPLFLVLNSLHFISLSPFF